MSEELSDAVAASAAKPKRVRVDGMGESEEHSLTDQIAADKHIANVRAASGKYGFGLRFAKLNPPGTQ
ncbi:MAG: hypothetical protein WCQ69_10690 [Bacteroidales bacterium]